MRQLSQIYLLLLLIFGLTGCQSLHYYQQAANGQLSLLWNRKPIDDVLADPTTPDALREKLTLAMEARDFAAEQLALPVDDTFSDFVALDQPYVVYNLMVAPEFSLEPLAWCYPIVGCQSYRGYFHLDDARAARECYAREDMDTFIGGVTAYSTLGWFDDPLQSGFTTLPDEQMVALMLHELAHKVIYVADDTRFNESFATAVELEGLKLWLELTDQPDKYQVTLMRLERWGATLELIEQTAHRLSELYGQRAALDASVLRERKTDILLQLQSDYAQLEEAWGQPGPLSGVIAEINNAVLGLFRQYNADVPGFRQMLADTDGDFARFYDEVKELARAPADVRRRRLEALGESFNEDL
ncbi:aminopeptidase [Marinobacter nanhaiticus D15-8W]|uniref:Zinc protease n=1 Tax=Marinobacter nanhaiticus D15-8W TaxID=626887 RepID=N6X3P4_9GAMM|nr:aminopeptidase [Marinobacter nanhaiticus]ENO15673.1 zinc protease [Marinobacter nanhaiticus D15-8W]BES73476.1 aminopeptidase [Marinobacter nanhaiticus D15-8W]